MSWGTNENANTYNYFCCFCTTGNRRGTLPFIDNRFLCACSVANDDQYASNVPDGITTELLSGSPHPHPRVLGSAEEDHAPLLSMTTRSKTRAEEALLTKEGECLSKIAVLDCHGDQLEDKGLPSFCGAIHMFSNCGRGVGV